MNKFLTVLIAMVVAFVGGLYAVGFVEEPPITDARARSDAHRYNIGHADGYVESEQKMVTRLTKALEKDGFVVFQKEDGVLITLVEQIAE